MSPTPWILLLLAALAAQGDEPPEPALPQFTDVTEQAGIGFVHSFGDHELSNIVEATVPLSEKSVTSSEPATFVLELNAGTTGRLAIDEDSRLVWEPAME